MGWSLVGREGDEYQYITSGVQGLAREDGESFQAYRDRLRDYWLWEAEEFLVGADFLAYEALPAVGSGNFVAATQSELAKTAILVIEVIALQRGLEVKRIAANTIKKNLTGNGRATKVHIRNSVIDVFPELLPRRRELTTIADESDAISIGLAALGYKWKKPTKT
jgi:hypothetical protein